MKCPICEQDIGKKPAVFQKKYFPRLLKDESICKRCYESLSEKDIYNKLAHAEGEEEQVKHPPVTPFASGHSMAQWVVFLLAVQIFLGLASFLVGLFALSSFPRLEDWWKNADTLATFLYIITGIVFLMWLHRAHRNLPALGAQKLKHTHGWAVGGFFFPIVNLYHPFGVVREIWKASDPDSLDGTSWTTTRTWPLIGWWWALFLISIFLNKILNRMEKANVAALEDLSYGLLALGFLITFVVAAILAIRLVREIDRRQEAKSKRVAAIDSFLASIETPAPDTTAPPSITGETISEVGPSDPKSYEETLKKIIEETKPVKPKTRPLLVGLGVAALLCVVVVAGFLIWLSTRPEGGVRMANNMEQYALKYIEEYNLLQDTETLIAYYDATLTMNGSEAALLTTKRVIYHKEGQIWWIDLRDIENVRHRYDSFIGDIVDVRSKSGMHLELVFFPSDNGELFYKALLEALRAIKMA